MAGPLAAAGATSEPSEYAPLTMDRMITGLWTQRSPLRDAAVPYLQAKYYSATRFDSLIDGVNREITSRLTSARRPGSSVYNSASWSRINSFYSFKWISGAGEEIQIIVDEQTLGGGEVFDGTGPSTKNLLFSPDLAAGRWRYASVGNELFAANGVSAKKYLQPQLIRHATTSYSVGNFIRDTNGNLQEVQAVSISANIATIQVLAILGITYVRVGLTSESPFSPGLGANPTLTFAGLSSASFLNGQTLGNITEIAGNVIQVQPFSHAAYGPATDTGTVTGLSYELQSGISGAGAPTWNPTPGGTTNDGTLVWINRGLGAYGWGVIAPTVAPTVVPGSAGGNRFWQPQTFFVSRYAILDPAGNLQVSNGGTSGLFSPMWGAAPAGGTFDGTITWTNWGPVGSWMPATASGVFAKGAILDSNGNLQIASNAGTTAGSVPTWNATLFGTTTDNTVTWTNVGPGVQLTTAAIGYGYAFHSIDGSVTNVSPVTSITGQVLGSAAAGFQLAISGPGPGSDLQYDQIWIYRISQGGSILLQLDTIPSTGTSPWSYLDTLPDAALNAFSEAPIDNQNNPPPKGTVAPCEHVGRIWVAVGATLYYSTGPDTNGGSNGNTAFNPSNNIPLPELITRMDSVTLSSGPALIVWTTSNVRVVTGIGTTNNPFVPGMFMANVGLLSYDLVDAVGSTFYLMSNSGKGVSIDPGAGYVEVGFPIGDQFELVNTAGQNQALFTPQTGYVTWHEKQSGDTGMYYCDGNKGWFRYSPVASPESGFLWSPMALIEGGTSAVQSVETAPGVPNLLIGPRNGITGPILFRDTTTNQDNGTPYDDCYITVGNIQLCESGEIAEIAHIALDSMAIGTKPTVGILMGEIYETPEVPFDMLDVTSPDPPDLPEAQTLYNDRYSAAQNGVCPKCRHFQLLIQYTSENAADELLTHTIFGAKHSERKQQ